MPHFRTFAFGGVCLLALLSCKSMTGVERSRALVDGTESLKSSMHEIQVGLGAVSSALDALQAEGGDVALEFATFRTEVGKLRKHFDTYESRLDDQRDLQESHLSAWKKDIEEIGNESLRASAEERRTVVQDLFEEQAKGSAAVAEARKKTMASLADMESFLANDLSEASLAALRDPIREFTKNSKELVKALETLRGQLDSVAKALGDQGMRTDGLKV